jgi:hypothetical protein
MFFSQAEKNQKAWALGEKAGARHPDTSIPPLQ